MSSEDPEIGISPAKISATPYQAEQMLLTLSQRAQQQPTSGTIPRLPCGPPPKPRTITGIPNLITSGRVLPWPPSVPRKPQPISQPGADLSLAIQHILNELLKLSPTNSPMAYLFENMLNHR